MMPMGCTLSNAAQDALGSADSQALAGTGAGRHVSSATTDVLIDEAISGDAASATETPAETKKYKSLSAGLCGP